MEALPDEMGVTVASSDRGVASESPEGGITKSYDYVRGDRCEFGVETHPLGEKIFGKIFAGLECGDGFEAEFLFDK